MAKTWATKCCSGTYKNNYQLCCGIKEKAIMQDTKFSKTFYNTLQINTLT
ncbi:hypothetical protein [Parabacteroides distasonis]|nr:hypothetical protein [Parabacteroides distasonis]